jgi:putative long chain acyl-CoA synthase
MRRDVWDKLVERFGPVGVLEFYASTETNAVLANASGKKSGAVGRPMPGSREMRIARYDYSKGALDRDERGFCRECDPQEAGVLLTRLDDADLRTTPSPRVLRNTFESGDAWYNTGSLLRKDADGDYWFEERVADLIQLGERQILSRPIEDAAYQIDEVALAAAYRDGDDSPITLAVQLREDASLDADEVGEQLLQLEEFRRPTLVRVMKDMPISDGFRPLKEALRSGAGQEVARFSYDAKAERYKTA